MNDPTSEAVGRFSAQFMENIESIAKAFKDADAQLVEMTEGRDYWYKRCQRSEAKLAAYLMASESTYQGVWPGSAPSGEEPGPLPAATALGDPHLSVNALHAALVAGRNRDRELIDSVTHWYHLISERDDPDDNNLINAIERYLNKDRNQ